MDTSARTAEGDAAPGGKGVSDQLTGAAAETAKTSGTDTAAGTGDPSADGGTVEKAAATAGADAPQSEMGRPPQVSSAQSPGSGKNANPAGAGQSQKLDAEAESLDVQRRASAGGAHTGRGGSAPATTAHESLGGKAGESISGSRVTTGGDEQTGGNQASSSTSGEQRFAFESNEGNTSGTPQVTKEGGEAGEFSVRGTASAAAAHERSALGTGASGGQDVPASAARNQAANPGSPTALNGSGPGSGSVSHSDAAARGSQPSPQPTTDAGRPAGSPAARVEQALNADFERGFVGRLRDNGEMRLTVHRSDLGDIELRVAVRESGVHASMATQDDQARQLLNSQRADLETALQRYNLRLDSFSVEVGGRGEGRSSHRHESEHAWPNQGGDSIVRGSGSAEAAPSARPQGYDRSGSGLSVRV